LINFCFFSSHCIIKVDEEATKAKNNIDQSTTNNDVDQAKTDGASAITKIQPDVVKKLFLAFVASSSTFAFAASFSSLVAS
jgi:hypothetical protein